MTANIMKKPVRPLTKKSRKQIVKDSAKVIRQIAKSPSIRPFVNPYNAKWEQEVWTVEKFNIEVLTIDVNPEWQRPDVDTLFHTSNFPSKAQAIIASMLIGLDIGEIKLCYFRGKRASIDGGNRKRAIKAFLDGKFPLHKKSPWGEVHYKDLHEDVRKALNAYRIRIVQYEEMDSNTIGALFRSTNMTTEVNDQEMLNSYGDNAVAVLIRTTVRRFKERNNTPHELFSESQISGKNGEKRYIHLSFNNHRLRMEDQLVRILHRIVEGKETPGPTPDRAKQDLYEKYGAIWEADPKEQKKVEKKLKEALDFFTKVAAAARADRKNGLPIGQYSMLTRLYFDLKMKHGAFKVEDFDAFWKEFSRTFAKISSIKTLYIKPDGTEGDKTLGKAFNSFLSFDLPEPWKIQYTINWFTKEFKASKVVTPLDPKRCFGSEKVEQVLALQNWKDYIDGLPLSLDRAVGAHIKAWSQGGLTDDDNIVVISDKHNRAMGTMNVEDYKRSLGY